ncbi:MarR family winged helix-turn-helix transcriptional regulator [Mongoliimonas terrestris]|uniref:MarR family winged helix-turn-helix transcriptional regulator n=1 Tax=Mongoliimonas terrestris TaxID=1709001 RepID=UPI0009F95841|nr:MarR family transcriptional regulator [Mongoliimonas terrestris]
MTDEDLGGESATAAAAGTERGDEGGEPSAAAGDHALAFRLLNEIAIIAQLSGTSFERAMPGTMTLPQFVVLNHLTRLGGDRTPLQIANAMQVTKGAMTNTLGHLERAGWIAVRPDPKDGRSKRVDITGAGRAAHGDAIRQLQPELAFLVGEIGPEPIAAALPFLERLRALLDRRRDEV